MYFFHGVGWHLELIAVQIEMCNLLLLVWYGGGAILRRRHVCGLGSADGKSQLSWLNFAKNENKENGVLYDM